jgi:membrane protein YqaA with SNARE-associated domain
MFKKVTAWADKIAHSPRTQWGLFVYCVLESVFIPVPPDVILVPLGLSRPKKALYFASLAAVGSVVGGVMGYCIGRFAFEPIAMPILEYFNAADVLPKMQALFEEYGIWVVGVSALSPLIPYRFTILAAGMGHMAFVPFVLMSLAMHWIRYSLVTCIAARYGKKTSTVIQKRLNWIFIGVGAVALVVLGLWLYVKP